MLQGQKLQQAYDDFIINYSIEKGLSQKTINNKRDILGKLLPFLGEKPITFENCREYAFYMYDNGWDKPNSRVSIIKCLRAFINFLHDREYIQENFSKKLTKPKVPKREFEYINPEIIEKIIFAGTKYGKHDRSRSRKIKDEMRQALRLILRTGLRINEIVLLKGSDLNLYDDPPSFWVHSKGGNRELLPLPQDMLSELITRRSRVHIFPVTPKTCNEVLERGAKALGIKTKITNHTLRHIFASNLVKNKVPIQMVSRLMRHSSVEITDKTYTHLDLKDLSLILNSNQNIVAKGLTQYQIFSNIQQIVKNTGIESDNRFSLSIESTEKSLKVIITYK